MKVFGNIGRSESLVYRETRRVLCRLSQAKREQGFLALGDQIREMRRADALQAGN